MTNPSKFIGIFLLFGVGVFSIFLIVKNFLPSNNSLNPNQFNLGTSIKNIFSKTEETISSQINQKQSTTTTENFTDALGQLLANRIESENTSGQSVTSSINVNNISEEMMKYLSTTTVDFFPKINGQDIKISQDTSAQNQLNYLKTLQDISQKYIKEYNYNKPALDVFNEIVNKNDSSSAKNVAEGSKAVLNDYYQVIVPLNWVDFHKKILSYFSANQMVYEALADYNNDPAKSYLAVNAIPQLGALAEELQKILTEQAINNNLDLSKI